MWVNHGAWEGSACTRSTSARLTVRYDRRHGLTPRTASAAAAMRASSRQAMLKAILGCRLRNNGYEGQPSVKNY